jgi:tricorn protease
MKRSLLLCWAMLGLACTTFCAEEARLLRFPDVHSDAVAFVYAGDIYTVPRAGGQALRLTSHEGLELFPKFSPDGKQIAFCGQYDGDMSVYVMPAEGGKPTRLTYHPGIQNTGERFGPENIVMGWHPGGRKVLFRSRQESNDWWDGRAYLVDVSGGLPEPLPMQAAGFTSFSPDARKVAYCPIARDFRTWKRYKGGMAQNVWMFDLESYDARKITDWVGTDNMPMWYQERIYFNSDRTGTLNIFCYDLNTGQTRQVTEFTDYDVRWPSLGPDGIAFENGGYIYVLDLPSETLHKITIHLAYDLHAVRPEFVSVSDKVRDGDVSPDGKRAVFSARGDIFTVPAKKGNTRNLTDNCAANDRAAGWSPTGEWIAYISDATGEEELYLVSQDGKETVRLTTDGHCRKYEPQWSPDGAMLAFSDKDLNLYYVNVNTKKVVKFDQTRRNEVRRFAWSPDSRFLAYTKQGDNRIDAIYIYKLGDASIHQVTPGFTDDFEPTFDPDGKYLYFLSQRNFNPIMSAYESQFVNDAITNLFLIVLSSDEQSPFAPKSDEAGMVEEKSETKTDDAKKKEEKKKEAVTVRIDFEGIFERQVAFDLPAGSYGSLAAIPGAVFYASRPIHGLEGKVGREETVLHKYDMKEQKDYEFATGINQYTIAAEGDNVLLKKGDTYHITSTSGKKAELDETKLDLSHIEMRVDRTAEYRQMFDEVWRMERDFFYDENMHGVDWNKMYKKYSVLLPYVAHRFDLTYVIGEMIGELSCSHTYVGGGDKPDIPSSKVGLLGVDFEVDRQSNRIRIARILDGENWDDALRSPLLEPGIDVNEGDYLLAIDGAQITADVNPYSLTENDVGRTITLTVNGKPSMEGAREVTVKPIASEEKLRYYNWVEDRRKHVDSVSNGQIGYIHIPDMDSFGLVRFMKMFYYQLRKPGLIIDVRYNGGGWVSGLILERLRREVVAMGASRTFAEGPAPDEGIHAHMITLLNEFSCSDGDYFPYFFRQYKLGPLMGKRSWGGVIGIRDFQRLVDGGYFTVPEFSIYSLQGKWIMENIGVEPDIEVENHPTRLAQGYDDQLDGAIEYILDKLKKEPMVLPPEPGPPTPR